MLEIDQKIMELGEFIYLSTFPSMRCMFSRDVRNAHWELLARSRRGEIPPIKSGLDYETLRAAILTTHPVLAACPWLHDHSDIPDE